MMKWLSLLLLTGCMANNGLGSAAMSEDNIWNLSRLCIGMNESQVLHVMNHPYMKRSFENQGDVYQVWFYVTRPVGLDQSRLVRQNLTPLTFENGVLLGWGFDFYHQVIRKIEKPITPEKAAPSQKQGEDKSLEKAIEGLQNTQDSQKPAIPIMTQSQTPDRDKEAKKRRSKPETKKEKPKKKNDEHPDEQDSKMIEEENDQNFNFW